MTICIENNSLILNPWVKRADIGIVLIKPWAIKFGVTPPAGPVDSS